MDLPNCQLIKGIGTYGKMLAGGAACAFAALQQLLGQLIQSIGTSHLFLLILDVFVFLLS